jgi:hypothetical protein
MNVKRRPFKSQAYVTLVDIAFVFVSEIYRIHAESVTYERQRTR